MKKNDCPPSPNIRTMYLKYIIRNVQFSKYFVKIVKMKSKKFNPILLFMIRRQEYFRSLTG